MKKSVSSARLAFCLTACLSIPLLAACVPGSAAPGAGNDARHCGADRLQNLVGQPLTLLPGKQISGPIRVLRPGTPATMDFIPGRLNVLTDAQDKITSLSCG